jgi:H+/Cl- antiporter ClcA
MNSMLPHATHHALEHASYSQITASVGVVAIVLLIVLLIEQEFIRALRGGGSSSKRTLQVAIVPLLITFAVIVVTRFAHLAYYASHQKR